MLIRTFKMSTSLVLFIAFQLIFSVEPLPDYSPREISALRDLRVLVNDALYKDYMKTDGYLIRWIRDRDFDLGKANQKLRKALEWRKQNGLDTMFQDPVLQMINETCPVQLSGFDRTGSPVVKMDYGACNVRKLVLKGLRPKVTRHIQSLLELGSISITERQKQGLNVSEMVVLCDFTGFSVREHMCLGCIPIYTELALIFESQYPQQLKLLVLFNSPKIFENVLQLLKPIVQTQTFERIKLFGTNKAEWQKAILDVISPDQLSSRYGGNRI